MSQHWPWSYTQKSQPGQWAEGNRAECQIEAKILESPYGNSVAASDQILKIFFSYIEPQVLFFLFFFHIFFFFFTDIFLFHRSYSYLSHTFISYLIAGQYKSHTASTGHPQGSVFGPFFVSFLYTENLKSLLKSVKETDCLKPFKFKNRLLFR